MPDLTDAQIIAQAKAALTDKYLPGRLFLNYPGWGPDSGRKRLRRTCGPVGKIVIESSMGYVVRFDAAEVIAYLEGLKKNA